MIGGVATKSCDTSQIWHQLLTLEVITRGELPGAAEYAQRKIGGLGRLTHQPVLFARVKLTKHPDSAVQRPVVARPTSTSTAGWSGSRSRASARATRSIGSGPGRGSGWNASPSTGKPGVAARRWPARTSGVTSPSPTHRPSYFPRPQEQRRILRRKAYTLATSTLEKAALEMDVLDYDFHLFIEEGTNQTASSTALGPPVTARHK